VRYNARDLKLARDVALKILPSHALPIDDVADRPTIAEALEQRTTKGMKPRRDIRSPGDR
jgi:hypothetical protein